MSNPRLAFLFERFVRRSIDLAEQGELMELINDPANDMELQMLIGRAIEESGDEIPLSGETARAILQTILGTPIPALQPETPDISVIRHSFRWWRTAAAVLFVLVAGGGTWLALHHKPEPPAQSTVAHDHAPGGNKATLTLSDGRKITLDSASTGVVAQQGNASIQKLAGGRLAYQSGVAATNTVVFNTLVTPRGGQYQLTLPDGTRVWLNAASSITYPTAFVGKERVVSMTGEAYFEVARDDDQPFRVKVGQEEVEDIGTAFDINAYPDERIVAATLVEGKVRVTSGAHGMLLQPGQQALADSLGRLQLKADADVEKIIAWKEGKFIFDHDDLPTIMRQLGRWYDLDVRYTGKPPAGHYSGIIGRNRSLVEVLHRLRATESIQFNLQDKTITIEP
jgi:ferric-dicitrate binding protein FerR (iron transport regulator)